ncbi:MAG TPA: hypothetical protein DCR14_06825 [Acidimicrobiaceae bacterium]|nr:hypothetical protein [Acidimicrobiaceae bacterium]
MAVVVESNPLSDDVRPLLTIAEAARLLRISHSLAYELAATYLASDCTVGLPVIRLGSCLRVPRWALVELMTTGNVVRLVAGALHQEAVGVR